MHSTHYLHITLEHAQHSPPPTNLLAGAVAGIREGSIAEGISVQRGVAPLQQLLHHPGALRLHRLAQLLLLHSINQDVHESGAGTAPSASTNSKSTLALPPPALSLAYTLAEKEQKKSY